jgi:bifunctional polynucleotide phosphatase/kinase
MNLKFYVPEEIFDAEPMKPIKKISIPDHKEIIIMIGYPGSGKSTLAKEQFASRGYYLVDGDLLKTAKAMIKDAREHPDQSIIFDATNGTRERRQFYIDYGKEIGLPVRCIWVNTSIEKALDRVKKREQEIGVKIPAVVLYLYRKKFEEPTTDECEVIKIDQD